MDKGEEQRTKACSRGFSGTRLERRPVWDPQGMECFPLYGGKGYLVRVSIQKNGRAIDGTNLLRRILTMRPVHRGGKHTVSEIAKNLKNDGKTAI